MESTIYGLISPFDSEIRYIGRTRERPEKRLRNHVRDAQKDKHHNKNLQCWILEILSSGGYPIIKPLHTCSQDLDRKFEWVYYEKHMGSGRLLNMVRLFDDHSTINIPNLCKIKRATKIKNREIAAIAGVSTVQVSCLLTGRTTELSFQRAKLIEAAILLQQRD
jgi:hypothetical protein